MHQSFEIPAPPPFGLEGGDSLFMQVKVSEVPVPGIKVSGAFPRPYFSTHGIFPL